MAEDDTNGGGRSKKPIPVRRTAGHARRTPREEEAREEEGAEAGASSSPVRDVVDGPGTATARRPEAADRRFVVEETEWIARVAGRTLCGTGQSTPKAPVMEVRFHRADEPESPVMRLMVAGRTLEDLYDDELRALFHRSRPVEGGDEGPGITLEGRPGG